MFVAEANIDFADEFIIYTKHGIQIQPILCKMYSRKFFGYINKNISKFFECKPTSKLRNG